MPDPIITLTTDFGEDSPYVAAMKGVILSVNPAARLVDLSHDIPAQDVRHTAYFLAGSVPYFPPSTTHVVVVDPGVGSDRALLCIEIGGQRLLAPDNGCWSRLTGEPKRVIRMTDPRYWRAEVSSTFQGRDILAPVAAHLSLGVDPALLGPPAEKWERLEFPAPWSLEDGVGGEIAFVDHFGNLITNIPAALVQRQPSQLVIDGISHQEFTWVRTYADAEPGHLSALFSSNGLVEIAVVQGRAAALLGVKTGASVILRWDHS